MSYPDHPGRTPRPMAQPQLPAFCRTRPLRPGPLLCGSNSLRRLLYLVLILQLSTVLLVLAGPVPRPLAATTGGFTAAPFASQSSAPVPSPFKP
jgi:hypothetical protein